MAEKEFDFLNDHSRQFLEMALDQERRQTVDHPDGYGKNTGECGDTIEIFILTRDDRIDKVAFVTDGCINTHACANTVAHMAEGKAVEDAWEITQDTLIEYLKTLPEESFHCAELAVGALYKALRNHQELKRNSWKKMYQKL